MKRKTDIRLIDELLDVDAPAPGFGQRELAVIDRLFRQDMPDGELINLYFLVHDWADDDAWVYGDRFKQIEDVLIGRMSGQTPDAGEERELPGFDPEEYRVATEAICTGAFSDWQVLKLHALAQSNAVDEDIGHRWQAIMDICRAQILRRIKATRQASMNRSGNETAPRPGRTPAEIEARHAANEVYGERIGAARIKLAMYPETLADALCLPDSDVKAAEKGNPPMDARLMLAPLLLAADYYPDDEAIWHLTSRTYVAHFFEAQRRMTPKVREIWLLHHADGLTGPEIAEWQNLSKSMIVQRLKEGERAIKMFGPQPPKPTRRKLRGPRL
ncbi:MAG: hypothetical protein QM647_09300 [Asticcacaulis sp.]|uniref:hypothetical protein n=1 Tax=Asticcacaulis sp. TaxID=1872648 RepID=UPI0039E24793